MEVNLRFTDDTLKGHYANMMNVTQTSPEEFVLDFAMIVPPTGELVSRITVSPGHLKRMIDVMQQRLDIHEKANGKVSETVPPASQFGFDTKPKDQ